MCVLQHHDARGTGYDVYFGACNNFFAVFGGLVLGVVW